MNESSVQSPVTGDKQWPAEVEQMYERQEVLGKGSFGMVWMSRRLKNPEDEFDDEYVAVKSIHIKDEKGAVYAEREISILQELRHPNVIRLIRGFPRYGSTRVVVMQLARGPNLHQLIVKRGALGIPLCRLVSRQLIAAVSYLHGRAVIHRDIKPSNCILACNTIAPTEEYEWAFDDAIWSNNEDCVAAVKANKWKLMLIDFGFARALEKEEITAQSRHLRNSIVYESYTPAKIPIIRENGAPHNDDESVTSEDLQMLDKMAENAANELRRKSYVATNETEEAIMGTGKMRKRESGVSMALPDAKGTSAKERPKRVSTARHNIRSMSALGTKAYAAPEIRKQLRQKTDEDFDKANAAMTECVADYGMIVDAYSVGWTLRVVMTGVPPNFTISEYMEERDNVMMEDEAEDLSPVCCCLKPDLLYVVKIRDPTMIPYEATILITKMTEKMADDRMTVREAQNHPWITGGPDEVKYVLPEGDVPSKHGDPLVPLNCASTLSKLTIDYHLQ